MGSPNILVIAIDTMRRDRLGCYGYARKTSPHIDRIASEGTAFDSVFVNHYPTMPSFTTFYTGLDGIEHNIVRQGRGPLLSTKITSFPERLRGVGYTTAAVDSIVALRHGLPSHFARGYDHFLGYRYDPAERSQATYITDRGIALLDLLKGELFFLMLHYWDPHIPYWPPTDASGIFGVPAINPGEATLVEQFAAKEDEAAMLLLRSMRMERVTNYDFVNSQYDAAIWNADREVGRVLAKLDELDLARDTLVIVLSDHGECFGEFGVHFEHSGPGEGNLRVPLILRFPGSITAGKRVKEFVQTTDLTATIFDIAGLERSAEMRGTSLLDGIAERPFVVSAESTRQSNWILRTRDWKLVLPAVDLQTGVPYPDLLGNPRGGPTLHDVHASPADEGTDLSAKHPEVAKSLSQQLRGWLNERLNGRPDPLDVQGPNAFWPEWRDFWLRLIKSYGEKSGLSWAVGGHNAKFGTDPTRPIPGQAF